METYQWYATLVKPDWAPPAWVFGPVWTILYILIIISFGYVLWGVAKKQLPKQLLIPIILNLVFNLAFTPIQFGLRNLPLASLDVILVLATLISALVMIFPRVRWVAYMNIPYLLWTAFATLLQLTITVMNRV